MNEKVKCSICSAELKELFGHVKRKHGMTIEEYQTKFPDALLVSEATQAKRDKVLKSEERLARLQQNSIQRWTGEGSEFQRAEASERASVRNKERWANDPAYREHMIRKMSVAMTKQMSDPKRRDKNRQSSRKAWDKPEEQIVARRQKFLETTTAAGIAYIRSKEARELMSKKMRKLMNEGKAGRIRNDNKHTKPDGTELTFKSRWERAYALYLESQGFDYEYEPITIKYTDEQGVTRRYTPDFFVSQLDKYVEVKGFYKDRMKEVLYKIQRLEEETGKECILADRAYLTSIGLLTPSGSVRGK
ncbi:Phage endonuclease I [compost metagenome]